MRRGRSSVSDFLTNFNAAFDTVNKVGREVETSRIASAKPEESTGFTAQQGQELESLAKSGFDNITFDDASNSYVAKNAAGDTKTVAMQGVTDFMGTRHAGQGQQVEDNARAHAYANAMEKYGDPAAGMKMRQTAQQGIRDAKRFAWEEQAQPAKQQALELGVAGAQRQERQGARGDIVQQLDDAVAQMPLDALEVYASRLNSNDSKVPMLYAGQSEGGYKFLSMDPNNGRPTGQNFTLNEAQMRQLAGASVLGLAGYGKESMERMATVNKDMADYIGKWNDTLAKTVTSENNAAHLGRSDRRADEAGARAAAADGRAAVNHAQAQADRKAERETLETLYREGNPEATPAQIKAAGMGKLPVPGAGVSREERMRYTTLLGETSRRITDAQKTLSALQRDPMYSMAKPESPQQVELQGLRDTIAALSEERKTYQRMLAESQAATPAAIASGGLAGKGAAQEPRKIGSKAEFDKLPSGAKYIDPNGSLRMKP